MTENTTPQRVPWWHRFIAAYRYLRSQEPARVIAFWRALLGVALAAGVTVPDWLDVKVSAVIAAVFVVMTFWQARATRAEVVPADNVPPQYFKENLNRPAA